jgi:OmpA-OmpF porin, OOP family
MSFNLIDAAKGLFTNELIGKASSFLGESETGVSKAVSGIVPTVLSGLMNKASSHEGAGAVANMVAEQHNGGILDNLSGFFGNDSGGLLSKGTSLLSGLFGNKTDGITSLISNFAGVKSSTSSSLLSMALPALLGLLGKHSSGGASGIASLFSSQKDNIAAAVPSGLNLSSVLGNWGNTASHAAAEVKTAANHYTEEVAEKSGGAMKFLLPLLLLAALAIGAWYIFSKGCGKAADTVADVSDTAKAKAVDVMADAKQTITAAVGKLDTLTGDWVYDAGEMATIELPSGGGSLTVGKNSTEYRLINFLNDKNAMLDTAKGNWFEFTNVHFKKGSGDLTEESMGQLKNMMLIAKAYPAAKFKFGGYTDNTGSDAVNIPLSQKRADAVANMVIKLGAAKDAITGAKGYGQQWPLATNDTPEGRAQNRRVAVNVKAK